MTAYLAPIEPMVEPEIGGKMQAGIEEHEEAGHAAQLYRPGDAGDEAQRRQCQRSQQADQRPSAGRTLDELDRIGGEVVIEAQPEQPRQRQQRQHKEQGLEPEQLLLADLPQCHES